MNVYASSSHCELSSIIDAYYTRKTPHRWQLIYTCTVKVVPQAQADKIKAPSRPSQSLQGQDQKGP